MEQEDFFKEIDEIYKEITRLEKTANFFVDDNPCEKCNSCCSTRTTLPVTAIDLDYIKARNPCPEYNEQKFISFLKQEYDGICPNYNETLRGCSIYAIRPLVCRTFGYTLASVLNTPAFCIYNGKKNPVWNEMQPLLDNFNFLRLQYSECISPKTPYDYIFSANEAISAGNLEQGIRLFEICENIFINSNNQRMFLNVRANKFEAQKNLEGALRAYYEILDLNPNDISSKIKLAYIELQLERYDDVIKHSLEILKYTETALVYSVLGIAYSRNKEYQKALEIYDAALVRFQKDNENLVVSKAITLEKLGRDEEAIEIFLKVLENDDKNALANFSIAICYMKKGDNQEAEKYFNKYQELSKLGL